MCGMGRTTRNVGQLFAPPSPGRLRRRSADEMEPNAALQAIWDVVAMIPRGRVRSYGDVARAAGFPGRARQAGYALRVMPQDLHLPWHRVVGAGGRIAFPKDSSHFREQSRRLRSEGVAVKEGRVPRSAFMDADLEASVPQR
jgi:methylated-DNA-protein-cysteine methyltransferase related protein